MASKPNATIPISRHPLFPAVVALWFAALLGLGSLVIRATVLEHIVLALHLDVVVPAAAPPLGFTARLLLALVLAAGGSLAGYLLARRLAGQSSVPARNCAAAAPDVIVPSAPSDGEIEAADGAEDEDLARLEAALNDNPRRRRPLALAEETYPAELHEIAPLPGGRPTILNIGELDPIHSLGNTRDADQPVPPPAAAAAPVIVAELESTAIEPDTPHASGAPHAAGLPAPSAAVPPAQTPPSPLAQKRQTPQPVANPPLAPLPHATAAPVSGTAAKRLREAPLDSLGVVELVERFALALESRRARTPVETPAETPTEPVASPESPSDFPRPFADNREGGSTISMNGEAARPFDIPAALRTPDVEDAAQDWTGGWFARADAPAPAGVADATALNGTVHSDEDPGESDSGDDQYSSLLDLKPSLRAGGIDPDTNRNGLHQPASTLREAIVPGAAFGDSPAETERALREALSALQRMSGAA